MISFGLNSLKVIQCWDEAAKLRAAFIMGLDFLYLIVYSTTLSLACIGAIQAFEILQSSWRYTRVYIALSQYLAGLFDILKIPIVYYL
ncbi:hypothetical protein RINTHH_18460 [Richelia intracellularis HH01]|uniref:Uncharacterized protein n=1 Tax=Richelia intracellularis HH01 TaxID=1165094 RepID=M1X6A4_9NOST|nr:hypothetical protein [Richelia intracellularis]CCH68001.1 hypothetical protein RINTHH_18460 [Richelia intracellularis HH01]HAE05891.1 hypothetical protein [Richelia sp.]